MQILASNIFLTLILIGGNLLGQSEILEKAPTHGDWKSFAPGTWIIEKSTYRGVSYHEDGVEYQRTLLFGSNALGDAQCIRHKSISAQGPWTLLFQDGDVTEMKSRKQLPDEGILIGQKPVQCHVFRSESNDDYGKTACMEWLDAVSGLDLKKNVEFKGQDDKGRPITNSSQMVTTRYEKQTFEGQKFMVALQTYTEVDRGLIQKVYHWAGTISVPGHRLRMKYWLGAEKGEQPNCEIDLLDWGVDPKLLAQVRKENPSWEERQRQEEEKRKQEVSELMRHTMVDASSKDEEVRFGAIRCLASWPILEGESRDVIRILTSALDDRSAKIRREAAYGLAEHHAKDVATKIVEMNKEDPAGATFYVSALGLLVDPAGFESILPAITSEEGAVREAAAKALGSFKNDSGRIALEKALSDPSWSVRIVATESLQKIGSQRSLPALIKAMKDKNALVRCSVVAAVATLNAPESVPALIEAMGDPDEGVREEACSHAGRMSLANNQIIQDAILKLLSDKSTHMQATAMIVLGEIKEKRAVPQLLECLKKRNCFTAKDEFFESLGEVAVRALADIGDTRALPILEELLQKPESREVACEALIKMEDSRTARVFWNLYRQSPKKDREDQFHEKLLEGIAAIGGKDILGELKEYLEKCPPPEKSPIRGTIQKIETRSSGKSN